MPLVRAIAQLRVSQARRVRACCVLLVGVLLALAGCAGGSAGVTARPTATSVAPVTYPCATAATGAAATRTTPPVIYVAMGASDGNGVGADHPTTEGYVPLLIRRLPAGSRCLNPSVSGTTLHEALGSELPITLQAHPTLVTVWLAANDFSACVPLQQYGADVNTLLGDLQTQTHARVFVANLPDMSLLPRFQAGGQGGGVCLQGASASQIRALAVQWNGVIGASVAQHGDVLVDLFNSELASHPELIASDGFHPSTAGYARLADLFWAQIQAHGGVAQRG
jgi:acyl-CoA thioesterase I